MLPCFFTHHPPYPQQTDVEGVQGGIPDQSRDFRFPTDRSSFRLVYPVEVPPNFPV